MTYFRRLGSNTFQPTDLVGGAWSTTEQHIGPALGLLAHVVEENRDRRRQDGLAVARLSYDILGTVPLDTCHTEVSVLRPGRTIELVEATLGQTGRVAVRLRAWLMAERDTEQFAADPRSTIEPPDEMPAWDPTTIWPAAGFIASVEVRRIEQAPGRASYWVRTPFPLLDDEEVSPLAGAAGLLDIANGMAIRAHPDEVAFPNVDLTAHFFTQPRSDWIGFDTIVTFGANGIGTTTSTLHDLYGPMGIQNQLLTIRPAS